MKVLHINSYYSTSKFYKNMFDEQIKAGLDIDVFVPVAKGFVSEFDFGDYSTISNNHNKYDRYLFHLKQGKILSDIQQKYDISNYSIIHAHSLFTNGYVAYKLYKKYGIPYVVAVRNTDINVFFKKMMHLRKLGVNILLNAKSIVLISRTYKDKLLDKYIPNKFINKIENKISIIPNGIDEYWLTNKSEVRDKIDMSNIKLLQVGDVNKNKNQLTTLKSVQILRDAGYTVKLTVVGQSKDQSILKELKKYSFLKYIPQTTKEELINIYRENDIFILPSIYETFGLVYPEAMSQGLPVIYTRNQGFDGQFEDGVVGYSVDCFDVEEIAKKILNVIEEYDELSKRSINKVDIFRWKKITEKYIVNGYS